MRILALGGTQFVGRAFVEAALARGHELTLLHRGKTPIPAGWQVEEILGDRNGDLSELGDRTWDAVYDSCAYVPRVVRTAISALRERCHRYLFISTISVYDFELKLQRPTTPLATEEINGETYGPLKVECEDVVVGAFGDRSTIVRPGLIIGPHDHTGRFGYWVNRFASYGEVLVPEAPGSGLQQVDARDLADFCVGLLERDQGGTYHVAGEASTFDAMIAMCAAVGGGEAVRVPISALEAHGVDPSEFPLLWAPDAARLMSLPCTESLEAGLQRRSLKQSTEDTLAWLLSLEGDRPVGRFTREREEMVLSQLRA